MRLLLRGCGLTVLALACLSPGALAQDANANATPANVTGVVVNANTGSGIARALVQLGGRAMLTDHDGKFEFDDFTETHAILRVTKPGYYFALEPMNDGSRMLSSADWSSPLTLQLYPEALLTGTVTAQDGSPLRGVLVNAMRSIFDENGHRWMPVPRMGSTNIRGEFRIPVPAGEYKLRTYYVQRREDGDVIMPLTFPSNTSNSASGLIRVSSGEEQHFNLHPGVGRAYTVWLSVESSDPGMPAIQVHTADGGVFMVGAQIGAGNLYRVELPNGSYALTATKYSPDGQQIAETNVTVAGHDVSGVVLRFQSMPTVPLEIHVDSSAADSGDGAMPANPYFLGLVLQDESQDFDMRMFSPEQKDGEFGFRVQGPGSYRLKARNNGSPWYVESATYGDRDLLRQDMVIAPGGTGLPIEVTVSNQTGTLIGTVSVHGVPGRSWIYLIATTPSLTPVVGMQSHGNNRVSVGGISSGSGRAFTMGLASREYQASGVAGAYMMHLAPGSYQAIAFEQRHEADFSNPETLEPYASHVRTITIHAGDKATLDLDAVTDAEVKQ